MMGSNPEHTDVGSSPTASEFATTFDHADDQKEFSTTPEVLQNGSEADGPGESVEEDIKYPSGLKLVSIILSLYFAVLLTVLDRTILVTAIPRIVEDFHSINDIGWYGSAFLVTSASTILLFGKIYTFYSTKLVFLGCIVLFEIGSAVCGAAPNSDSFIVGRAIAGLGASGITIGAMTIMIYTVPLQKRPLFMAPFFSIMSITNVVAPLIGGAFTDHVSWRWCFYINLPIGGSTIILLVFLLHPPKQASTSKYFELPLLQQFTKLDPIGTGVFLPGMICLLLALSWGGSTYAWANWRLILLLVLSAILLPLFLLLQFLRPETATISPRIFTQRSIYSAFSFQLFLGACMYLFVYYLPIYFQDVRGNTAFTSGLKLLPLVISMIIGGFISGGITYRTGYYTINMIISSVIASVGTGLLTTLDPYSNSGKWIGFQVVFGLGLGIGTQNANMAAQTVLKMEDQPVGTALMAFGMTVGGTVFLSAADSIFVNRLKGSLEQIQGLSAEVFKQLIGSGATNVRDMVDGDLLEEVLGAYTRAIKGVFYLAMGLACATIFGALGTEFKNVKKIKGKGKREEESQEANPGTQQKKKSDEEILA